MCGIVGAVHPGQDDLESLVVAMRDTLTHRGPDDAGVRVWGDHGLGLGHRRLSIIDISSAGRNPLSNEDGTVWVVVNGEIYNFKELRLELEALGHTFRSQTDTEVIVHAYEEWGDEHIHRLRGMFAYALYDRRPVGNSDGASNSTRFRLLLVRDRLGIKPLFYYTDNRKFLFGSEIKALLSYPEIDRSIDKSAVFDYFTYLYIPAPKTAYAGIRKLAPGHLLIIENERIELRQYWDAPLERHSPVRTISEAVEMVRATVAEAVGLHLVSDVPIGVFLSGGIDSSAMTAFMARTGAKPIRTFSMGFDVASHSETQYARLVAECYHTEHHEGIVGGGAIQLLLPRIARMYDEPYADGSAVPTLQLSAMAREEVKVVLSGDGGDEVFAGYNWYSAWLHLQAAEQSVAPWRRWLWPFSQTGSSSGWHGEQPPGPGNDESLAQYARLLELFSPIEKRDLLTPEWTREFADYDDYWAFRRYWHPDLDPLTRVQYLDLKTYLPDDILTKIDRASMAVSLEVRPPLLDHVLVEQMFSLPGEWRAPQGNKKHLLKLAVKDILPNTIINRPKKGFSAPYTTWIEGNRDWAERMLATDPAHPPVFRSNLAKMPSISRYGEKVWAALILHTWFAAQT